MERLIFQECRPLHRRLLQVCKCLGGMCRGHPDGINERWGSSLLPFPGHPDVKVSAERGALLLQIREEERRMNNASQIVCKCVNLILLPPKSL